MIIYRVQNNEGIGPYRGVATNLWTNRKHCAYNGQPIPSYENWKDLYTADINDGFRYGFKDIDQLLSWFNGIELDKLCRLGYNIVTIELDEQQVWLGERQVAFETWGDL